jgi:hypothetical protein
MPVMVRDTKGWVTSPESEIFSAPSCFGMPFKGAGFWRAVCKRWNLPVLTTRDAFACDLSEVLTDTVRTDIPTIPKVQLPASQPNNLPLNDLQQDYLGLIAANRGIELPHLETEDDARRFMARIAK